MPAKSCKRIATIARILICFVRFRSLVHPNRCHQQLEALPGCAPTQNDSCLLAAAVAAVPCELPLCLGSRGGKSKARGEKNTSRVGG